MIRPETHMSVSLKSARRREAAWPLSPVSWLHQNIDRRSEPGGAGDIGQARRGARPDRGGAAACGHARPVQTREKHAAERASRRSAPADRHHSRDRDPDLRARCERAIASDRVRGFAQAPRISLVRLPGNSRPSSRSMWQSPRMRKTGSRSAVSRSRSIPATFSDRVILVHTPGVGSTFLHNSRAAEAVLSDCDVGIFVLSPDPPITEVELGYLDDVRRVVPKLYFALNKVDLLSSDERDIAMSFLANVLEDKLGPGRRPAFSRCRRRPDSSPSERETEPRSRQAGCSNSSRLSRAS